MVVERLGDTTQVRFLMPHRDICVLADVVDCARLSPNFIKCLIGEPKKTLGESYLASALPVLAPFKGCDGVDAAAWLFEDLRASLAITPDEHDFLSIWAPYDRFGEPIPTNDRWVQRLCLRYAGQSPVAINTTLRLAQTLRADSSSGLHNSLGLFADASHFIRTCRAWTGHTPTKWRHMSQTFY